MRQSQVVLLTLPCSKVVFAFLVLAVASADDDNVCESHEAGAELSACLLQHNLGKEASYVGLRSKKVSRRVSLFEIASNKEAFESYSGKEGSRTEMMSAMLEETQERCQSYQAHSFFFRRNTHDLAQTLAALALTFGSPTKPAAATAGVEPSGGVAVDTMAANTSLQVVTNAKNAVAAPHVLLYGAKVVQDDSNKAAEAMKSDETAVKTVAQAMKSDEKAEETDTENADEDSNENEDADANSNENEDGNATALSQTDQDPKEEEDKSNKVKSTQHDKLDEVVSKFIEGQSGSEDACHSKLLEARHQLNQLHDILTVLVARVNATETALILYDKELQEKLKQLVKIEKWKDEELEKCKIKKEEDTKMFLKLSEELMEMHQIAMPSVAMNMTGGTVSVGETIKTGNRVVEETKLSLVQAALQAVPENQLGRSGTLTSDLLAVPNLVDATHRAASDFQVCVHRHQSSSLLQESRGASAEESAEEFEGESEELNNEFQEDESGQPKRKRKGRKADLARNKPKNLKKDEKYMTSQGEASSDEKCKEEKEKLEETYVKAYVELSRLKAEYEALSKSTACFDAVNEEYNNQAPPLQEKAEKLAQLSKEAAEELKELKPRLNSAIEADKKLRKQVNDLNEECEDLPETISDLDKVRDAIRALSLCPGLYRPEFKMPKFVGKYVTFPQDATKQTDTEQDKAMQWACNEAFTGSRAAEFVEIEQRVVLDVPVKNESPNPLLAVCPNCAGEEDTAYKSGHARNCWAPDAPLNGDGVGKKCGKGTKAVICVVDQTSMRKIPGEGA